MSFSQGAKDCCVVIKIKQLDAWTMIFVLLVKLRLNRKLKPQKSLGNDYRPGQLYRKMDSFKIGKLLPRHRLLLLSYPLHS